MVVAGQTVLEFKEKLRPTLAEQGYDIPVDRFESCHVYPQLD